MAEDRKPQAQAAPKAKRERKTVEELLVNDFERLYRRAIQVGARMVRVEPKRRLAFTALLGKMGEMSDEMQRLLGVEDADKEPEA